MKLDLETLENAITTDGAAIRLRSRLQPAGGPGDKIFPATYAEGKDGRKHETKYATEMRVVDGERKLSVPIPSHHRRTVWNSRCSRPDGAAISACP